LGCAGGGSGGIIGLSDPAGNGIFHGKCDKAAAEPAGLAVSRGVGDFICPHGYRCREGGADRGGAGPVPGTESVHHSAGGEFFLEPDLFQCPGLRLCAAVAGASVDSCSFDDPTVPKNGQDCRLDSAAVPCLADLCCIPELGRVDVKLNDHIGAADSRPNILKIVLFFSTFLYYNRQKQKNHFP